MITEAIFNAFSIVIQTLLGLLPNIPNMPQPVTDSINTIIDLVGQTIGLISYIYTPIVLVFVFTLFIAVLFFDNIYKLVLWVYHKIRG